MRSTSTARTLECLSPTFEDFSVTAREWSLVAVLREALARDKVAHAKLKKQKLSKTEAKSQARMFVQNVHHFRDECLRDDQPPIEHVAIFDAAPRAWNLEQTAAFMRQKKKRPDFTICEPEFLLSCLVSCLDRHGTWATVVCLVGGGQEIITVRPGFRNGWIQSNDRFRNGMCNFRRQKCYPSFLPEHNGFVFWLSTSGRPRNLCNGSSVEKKIRGPLSISKMWQQNFRFRVWRSIGAASYGMVTSASAI